MNYYFEERILDTRQNELWTLKNFKLNNLVVGNYLVAKNNEEWASMVSVRTRYIQYQSWLDNVNTYFWQFCCINIFV